MSGSQILARITEALPAARQFIKGVLDSRLDALASKRNTDGRAVRWYKREDLFCLPYETRQIVECENVEDELLKASVSEVFSQRAGATLRDDNETSLVPKAVALCHRSLEITFEKQGLELASFVLGEDADDQVQQSIADHVDQAMDEFNVGGSERDLVKDAVLAVLRRTFYQSEPVERESIYQSSAEHTRCYLS